MTALSVIYVVGEAPDGGCGVRDYTLRLCAAMAERGHDARVLSTREHTMHRDSRRSDIVHLQYPSLGDRLSPLPMLSIARGMGRCLAVTLHEYSCAHPLRRALALALLSAARIRILTTDIERDAVRRTVHSRLRLTTIGIGLNVPVLREAGQPVPRRLAYFGLIGPNKGLESFLECAAVLSLANWEMVVIGGWPDAFEDYARGLQHSDVGRRVRWTGRLHEDAVAHELASSWCAYLPYRDGVSERRTSLLAAGSAGLPVITTRGAGTTGGIEERVLIAATALEASQLCTAMTPETRAVWSDRSRSLVDGHSWEHVAASHEAVYLEHLRRRGGS